MLQIVSTSIFMLAFLTSPDAVAQETGSTAPPDTLEQLESADGTSTQLPDDTPPTVEPPAAEPPTVEPPAAEPPTAAPPPAAPPPAAPPPAEPPPNIEVASDNRSPSRSDSSDSPSWQFEKPSVSPALSAVVYSDGTSAGALMGVGASVILPFKQVVEKGPYWGGYTRGVGQVFLGPDLYNGYAMRVGAFAGPRLGPLSLDVGPDFFSDTYIFGSATLAPVAAMGIPATAYLDFQTLMFYGGVEPAFYFSDIRKKVDWGSEELFGFGDEFTYRVGTAINVEKLGLSVGYTHRMTGYGLQRGVSFGIRL
ncbi:MAG: hypothetical protein GWP91_00410 [Rhodobacterales bacterium]|nr:hypothetical protein [Rhodobacterales bacterium]